MKAFYTYHRLRLMVQRHDVALLMTREEVKELSQKNTEYT